MTIFGKPTPDGRLLPVDLPDEQGRSLGLSPLNAGAVTIDPQNMGGILNTPPPAPMPSPAPVPAAPVPQTVPAPPEPTAEEKLNANIDKSTQEFLLSRLTPSYVKAQPEHTGLATTKLEFERPGQVSPAAAKEHARLLSEANNLDRLRVGAQAASLQAQAIQANVDSLQGQVDIGNLQQEAEDAHARQVAKQNRIDQLSAKITEQQNLASQSTAPTSENFWKDKGTVGGILAGLSIAFGGALQGLQGGENQGLVLVNQQIDRYIQDQKTKYEMANGKVDAAKNDYARFVQAYGDSETAEHAMRAEKSALVAAMIKQRATRVGSEELQRAATDLLPAWESQTMAAQAKTLETGAQKVTEEFKTTPAKPGGYAQPNVLKAAEEAARYRKALDTASGVVPGAKAPAEKEQHINQAVTLLNGQTVYAKDSASATEKNTIISTAPRVMARLDRMIKILHENPIAPNIGASGGELAALTAANQADTKGMIGLKSMRGGGDVLGILGGKGATELEPLRFGRRAGVISQIQAAKTFLEQKVEEAHKNLYTKPVGLPGEGPPKQQAEQPEPE